MRFAKPARGHRKFWALTRQDRNGVPQATVFRQLRDDGLILPFEYQSQRHELLPNSLARLGGARDEHLVWALTELGQLPSSPLLGRPGALWFPGLWGGVTYTVPIQPAVGVPGGADRSKGQQALGFHERRELTTAAGAEPVRGQRVNEERVDSVTGVGGRPPFVGNGASTRCAY